MTAIAAPATRAPRTAAFAVARGGSVVLRALERWFGVTPMGLAVLAAAVVIVVIGRVLLPSAATTLLGYGLLLVLGVSWLLGRRRLPIDAARSDLPARVTAGRSVDAELTLTARRRTSAFVVEEALDEALGTPVRVGIPILPSGQEIQHEYQFTPSRRGVYRVGPLIAEFTDPFGLTRRRQPIADRATIVVHPRTEPVIDRITSREWEDPPIRPPVTRPWPTGFEFYGMRDYVPGDDPRRIVWRAVAQYDTYLVRESEQGITDRVVIWLDTDREYHAPGAPSETFERGITVAASLAVQHLKDGFGVSIDVNDQRLVSAFRGAGKRIPLLDAFAPVTADDTPLTSAIDRLLVDPQRRAHNVLVTPHLTQEAAGRLRLVLERGVSLQLVLVLWDDTDPLSVHRAGGLGCPVVEVRVGVPLAASFRQLMGARR